MKKHLLLPLAIVAMSFQANAKIGEKGLAAQYIKQETTEGWNLVARGQRGKVGFWDFRLSQQESTDAVTATGAKFEVMQGNAYLGASTRTRGAFDLFAKVGGYYQTSKLQNIEIDDSGFAWALGTTFEPTFFNQRFQFVAMYGSELETYYSLEAIFKLSPKIGVSYRTMESESQTTTFFGLDFRF